MSFSQFNLHPKILKALEQCGYDQPTPIQVKSIPEVMQGKDLVATAQTGTGKTASFVLPSLDRILSTEAKSPAPRILILTPTRELANQITDAISKYARFMQCNVISIVGGMSYTTQLRGLSRPVDIIVATPGRLLDHMGNRKIDLSHVEILILDEADRMLDMGFIDDVRDIADATPDSRQTLLFSATMDDNLSHLINKLLKKPVRIDLSQENISPLQITQKIYYADNALHKNRLLEHFLVNENIFKAIIFSATKINADDLARDLQRQGIPAAALHGDMKQGARNRIIDQFKKGKIHFLVATDVASRGIDVKDISHVINYDLPKFFEDYVHRIGRTGRAGKTGIAISFVSPFDLKHVGRIERFIKNKIEVHTVPGLEPKSNDGSVRKDKSRYRDRDDQGRGGRDKASRNRDEFKKRRSRHDFKDERNSPKDFSGKPRDERLGGKKEKLRGGRRAESKTYESKSDDVDFKKPQKKEWDKGERKGRDFSESKRPFDRDRKPTRDREEGKSRFDRDDRKPRRDGDESRSRFDRDDRKPRRAGEESRGRFDRDDRKPRRGGDESKGRFDRDDRKPRGAGVESRGRFDSDRKPRRAGEESKGRFDRDDRKPRRSGEESKGRFDRDDRKPRRSGEETRGRFDRDDRKPRRDGDESKGRFDRDARKPRRDGDQSRNRSDRDERKPRRPGEEGRPDRDERKPRRDGEASSNRFERSDRKPSSGERTGGYRGRSLSKDDSRGGRAGAGRSKQRKPR